MSVAVPVVTESRNVLSKYAIVPQEIRDGLQRTAAIETFELRDQIYASVSHPDAPQTTIDRQAVVSVEEIVFPGDRVEPIPSRHRTEREVAPKYVYVLAADGGKVVAEVEARLCDDWRVAYEPAIGGGADPELAVRTAGSLLLEPGDYLFFLSPVRLTADALQWVRDYSASCCVAQTIEVGANHVATVDPFRWAADAHCAYYLPSLNVLDAFLGDRDRQALRVIGQTIKGWNEGRPHPYNPSLSIGADQYDTADDTDRKKLDDWLARYERERDQLIRAADEAAAYLVHWIDSHAHHAVEFAALEREGSELQHGIVQWAVILDRLDRTGPGAAYLRKLVRFQKHRIPNQLLWEVAPGEAEEEGEEEAGPGAPATSTAPMGKEVQTRYKTCRALLDIFTKTVPAYLDTFELKTPDEKVLWYLTKHLGVENIRGQHAARIHEVLDAANEADPRQLRAGVAFDEFVAGRRVRLRKTRHFNRKWRVLQRRAYDADGIRFRPSERIARLLRRANDATFEKLDNLPDGYHTAWKGFGYATTGMDGLLTLLNLHLAVAEYRYHVGKSEWDRRFRLASSLIGVGKFAGGVVRDMAKGRLTATTDLASSDFWRLNRATPTATRVYAGAAGALNVAGAVTGAIDFHFATKSFERSAASDDFGAQVGYGLQAAGAATAFTMSALALAAMSGAGFGSIGGPMGALVGAAAGVVVFVGGVVVSAFRDNPLETFARFSAFGTAGGKETHHAYPSWASYPVDLMHDQPDVQLRTLLGLLSSFRIQRIGGEDPLEVAGIHRPNAREASEGQPVSWVEIVPGEAADDGALEVQIDLRVEDGPREDAYRAALRVDLADDAVEVTRWEPGAMILRSAHEVTRDDSGRIETVRICLLPQFAWRRGDAQSAFFQDLHDGALVRVASCRVRARFANGSIRSPARGLWVQIDAREDEAVASTDDSHIVVESDDGFAPFQG